MSHDREPLKPMGVQNRDTVLVETAARAKKVGEQPAQGAAGVAEDSTARAGADSGSDRRGLSKVAADMVAARAHEQPIAALLIAGAVGALLMGLATLASRAD